MARRIDDGFSTIISFENYPSIKLWEKTLTPPGVDGGGAVDTTTMRNTAWRTMNPKKLKTMTDSSFTAAYDPAVYSDIVDACNETQRITVTFPDESTILFWGYINSFTPNENTEGEQPTASVAIVATNQNDAGVETAPVLG